MATMTAGAARVERRWFYVWMAAIFMVIAFTGFIPTFWAKVAVGTFAGRPVLYIHGALFFGWTLFLLTQTSLVAAGRTHDHRSWGVFGVSLATAMAFMVVLAEINAIRVGESLGMGDQARRFAIVPLNALVLFVGFVTLAIVNVRKAEVHKRLMILTMVPLSQAAIARVFQAVLSPGAVGPPPVFVSVGPGLVADLLVVAAMVFDWRTRGRPHPVYLIGLPLLLTAQILVVPLSATPAWMAFARGFEALAG